MANYTSNYNLYKPNIDDTDVQVAPTLETNFTTIDAEIKNRADEISNHTSSTTAHDSANITHGEGNVRDTLFDLGININEVDGRISQIVSQSGNDNTEIVDARGIYSVLRDRLNNIDSQLKKIEWLDIRDYGAKSEAEESGYDSTSAIQSVLTYCAALVQMGIKPRIKIPKGVFNVTTGVLSGFTSTSVIAGITFEGENQYSSVLYLKTGGISSWFYDNQSESKLENILFEKIGFTGDVRANANGFRITSAGAEKQFDFRNCAFGNNVNTRVGKDTTAGGMAGVLELQGTANADLMKFVNCRYNVDEFVVNNNNPQAVSVELHGCDGTINGDFFRFGATPGGSMRVFGGAFDMYPHPTNNPSYLVNCNSAGSHGVGNGDIVFFGIRLEVHGTNKGLVNAQNLTTSYTNVHFQGCNLAGSIDNTQTMVIISTRKVVTFRDSTLSEKILYQFVGTTANSSSPENSGLIVIENCQVGTSTATPLFQRFTVAGLGRVIARNNRTNGSKTTGATNVMDFDIGWQTSMSRDANVVKKIAVIIPTASLFPYSGNQQVWTVNLPVGAMVTRVYINKPAQGIGTSNYQLYVGLGDKSVIWGSSTLQAQNLQHTIDVAPMHTITSAVTTIGMWVDATNSGTSGSHTGLGFVEYI
jgi:hypothetical protein